jgi:regulatory protein
VTPRPAGADPMLGAGFQGGDPEAASVADGDGADPVANEQAVRKAIDLACSYVNRRERTVAEVRAQLERKGVAAAHAEEAVRTLLDQHLLDDERFVQMFVADKRELEHWGAQRIRRGLAARGIDRELAERALAAPPDAGDDGGHDEMGQALELLARRFPEPPRERRDRDRALGVLLRKGYEQELAIDALNAYARGT